jgi:transposase-like protein
MGVDSQGYKHVLGLREGSSENAMVVKDLLTLEKRMRRIMGYQQLLMLEAKLQDQDEQQGIARQIKSA